jgi:hypothetical protein
MAWPPHQNNPLQQGDNTDARESDFGDFQVAWTPVSEQSAVLSLDDDARETTSWPELFLSINPENNRNNQQQQQQQRSRVIIDTCSNGTSQWNTGSIPSWRQQLWRRRSHRQHLPHLWERLIWYDIRNTTSTKTIFEAIILAWQELFYSTYQTWDLILCSTAQNAVKAF